MEFDIVPPPILSHISESSPDHIAIMDINIKAFEQSSTTHIIEIIWKFDAQLELHDFVKKMQASDYKSLPEVLQEVSPLGVCL